MGTTRRKFDKEFKSQAVSMVLDDGLPKAQVARNLAIHPKSIGDWVKEFRLQGEESFPGKGKLSPLCERTKKLEKENKELKQEVEFLKKTAAYFASLRS